MRAANDELCLRIEQQLDRKRAMLGLLAGKDREITELEVDERELEERLD